jgi:hypothetical protein
MLSPARINTLPVRSSSRTTKIVVNVLVKDWHSVTHLIACSAVGKSIYLKSYSHISEYQFIYRNHLTSFLEMPRLQESRFKQPSNYKGSGDRKITINDYQNHEIRMGIGLVSWEINLKWVLCYFFHEIPNNIFL